MIKLHLGCGKNNILGFINIDLDNYPHINYQHDVSNLPMFQDNSIDLVYASHVLEHFKRNKPIHILKEWYRILKPYGILRIAVPDFEAIIKVYEKYKDMELIMGLLYGGQNYENNYHHIAFDFKYLENLLTQSGFKNIHKYEWQNTIHSRYDDYSQAYIPHMDKEHGILMSLNVEAMK